MEKRTIKTKEKWKYVSDEYDIDSSRNNKYSNDYILKIAYLLRDGKTPKEICDELNIEYNTTNVGLISSIKYRKAYTDLTKDIDMSGVRQEKKKDSREIAHNICKLLEKGYNYKQIIDELGLEDTKRIRDWLADIKTGRRYPDISSQYNIPKKNFIPTKITEETVIKICELLQEKYLANEKYNSHEVCKQSGLEDNDKNRNLVSNIKTRRNWKNISKDYKF